MREEKTYLNKNNNSQYITLMNDNVSVSPFGQNSVSDRAYKRTERLALAIYLVTNHVSENEELRKILRQNVNSLLTSITVQENLFQNIETLATALYNVRIILTNLDLLFASNLISEINLNILKNSFISFADFLKSSVGSEGANSVDLKGVFDEQTEHGGSTSVLGSGGGKEVASVVPKDSYIRRGAMRDTTRDTTSHKATKDRSGASSLENKKHGGSTSVLGKGEHGGSTSVLKNARLRTKAISTNRRVVILDMVAKTGRVTVKDVASQIPDASSKTLQRELMSLVSEGTLKKDGNKRWTVYTLVR